MESLIFIVANQWRWIIYVFAANNVFCGAQLSGWQSRMGIKFVGVNIEGGGLSNIVQTNDFDP